MRRNLGLDGAGPSSSSDPLKAARQTIRSQVTAREYTERQLVQAQSSIQDLRTRLRQVHHERETAVAAAQSAMAAKEAAERSMRAAEGALATERATRVRIEGVLRDAEATIRDLREKLAAANQNLHGVEAELAAVHKARQEPDDAMMVAPEMMEIAAPTDPEPAVPIVRRPVGRPRKIAVEKPITPSFEPEASSKDEAPSNRDIAAPTVRRPVGRPRKNAVTQPVVKPIMQRKNSPVPVKVVKKNAASRANDQEPVQWWVEGWKER
jgi:hypothetical protein